MKNLLTIFLVMVLCLGFSACDEDTATSEPTSHDILFNDLEITISTNVEVFDYNGKDVIKFPTTVKNIRDESHGLKNWNVSCFAPNGKETDSMNSRFDDGIKMGDLRSGATADYFMYFLYDGDGDYYLEFDDFSNKTDIKISVKK